MPTESGSNPCGNFVTPSKDAPVPTTFTRIEPDKSAPSSFARVKLQKLKLLFVKLASVKLASCRTTSRKSAFSRMAFANWVPANVAVRRLLLVKFAPIKSKLLNTIPAKFWLEKSTPGPIIPAESGSNPDVHLV